MSRFAFHDPETLDEALASLAAHGDAARLLAGGTDLLIGIHRGKIAPAHVVSLGRIPDLDRIAVNGGIRIGPMVTHRHLERAELFQGAMIALAEAARVVGGRQIRNVATPAGNICNGSPAADTVPVLLCLDAEVTTRSAGRVRQHALDDFFLGPGRTRLAPDEMLTEIHLPAPPPRTGTAFLKAGRRKAMEISVVCVAVRVTLDDGLSTIAEARIGLGAVAPTPIRARQAEFVLTGQAIEAGAFSEAGRLAAQEASPISDVRASADYRRHLISVLVPRALRLAIGRARGAPVSGADG